MAARTPKNGNRHPLSTSGFTINQLAREEECYEVAFDIIGRQPESISDA
jgi:hypothetical protein